MSGLSLPPLGSPARRLLVTLAIAVLAAGTVSCSSGDRASPADGEQATAISADEGGEAIIPGIVSVKIPPGAVSDAATLRVTTAGPAPDGMAGLFTTSSEPVLIELDTDLKREAELTFPLPPGALADGVGVAYRDDDTGQWVVVGGLVDEDEGSITVRTDHFSWWRTVVADVSSWVDGVAASALRIGSLRAEMPSCRPAPQGAVSIAPDPLRDVLLSCAETHDSGARFRITNNRGYATSILGPADSILEGVSFGGTPAAVGQAIAKAGGFGDLLPTYLPGGQTATFLLAGPIRGGVMFSSSPSPLTVGADLLSPLWDHVAESFAAPEKALAQVVDCMIDAMPVADNPSVERVAKLSVDCIESVAVQGGLARPGAFEGFKAALAKIRSGVRLVDLTVDNFRTDGLGAARFDFPASQPAAFGPGSRLSMSGLGRVRLGMTFGEARAVMKGGARVGNHTEYCQVLSSTDFPELLFISPPQEESVHAIAIYDGTFATESGIRVGSTESSVREAYPSSTLIDDESGGGYALIHAPSKESWLQVGIGAGRVNYLFLISGEYAGAPVVEFCA